MAEAWGFFSFLQPCSGSWLVNAWQKLEDLAIEIPINFHCQPWSLSLICITVVLFITGPTRFPGWGGFMKTERARSTASWKERSMPLLEWRMLLLYKPIRNSQGHGPTAKGMNLKKERATSKFLGLLKQYLELGLMASPFNRFSLHVLDSTLVWPLYSQCNYPVHNLLDWIHNIQMVIAP